MVPREEAKITNFSLYASPPVLPAVAVMVAMGVRPCAFHCGAGPRNPLGDAQPAQAIMLRPGVLMRLWATGLKSKVARDPGRARRVRIHAAQHETCRDSAPHKNSLASCLSLQRTTRIQG